MTYRIGIDAMGGDFAPSVVVRGAIESLGDNSDCALRLVGDADAVRKELEQLSFDADRVQVIHASQVIGMAEPPVDALRQKKDSSVLRVARMAAEGEVDAVISAGNTGAFVAACQLKIRPIAGVLRSGIAVPIPSFQGPFALCDCGANIQAKPAHLHQYALMASLYAERILGIENPRAAVLSVGEESEKGTTLVKQTHELLRADPRIEFVGNVEGRELFQDVCDVALCDGFVGNIILKLTEGVAEGFFQTLTDEFRSEHPDSQRRAEMQKVLDRVWSRHDYSEYGGAPLLGADGVCIICHGRSRERAIRNAVRVAREFLTNGMNEAIAARFAGD